MGHGGMGLRYCRGGGLSQTTVLPMLLPPAPSFLYIAYLVHDSLLQILGLRAPSE